MYDVWDESPFGIKKKFLDEEDSLAKTYFRSANQQFRRDGPFLL